MTEDNVRGLMTAAEAHRKARVREAEAFLRAKAGKKDITDGMATRMATVETDDEVTLTEALFMVAAQRLTQNPVIELEEECECH